MIKEKELDRNEPSTPLLKEEEKKSNFLLFDELLSHDDSDLENGNNQVENKVKKFNLGRLDQLKSTVTSSNHISSISNNNKLKQVKSTTNIFQTGVITDIRKENYQNNSKDS